MRLCAICAAPERGVLCRSCSLDTATGPTFLTAGGLVVTAGLAHRGVARRLVHALKYGAVVAAAEPLVEAMVERIPTGVEAVVPVPRATFRRWRYGIDAADVLAALVARSCGLPLLRALRPAPWWPRHAGRGDGPRARAGFTLRHAVGERCVLVDDVATTGATLDDALVTLRVPGCAALVGTAPSRVGRSQGSERRPREPGGGVANPRPTQRAYGGATRTRDLDIDVSSGTRVPVPTDRWMIDG